MPSLINKIIKILIFNNVMFNLGWGLILPIFAIFILQKIAIQDPVEAVKILGLSELCFGITRVVTQLPIGRYLDKNHGEKDDFWFMLVGTLIQAAIPLGFLF